MQTLADSSKWTLLKQKRFELLATTIFRELHESGFQPILIKGWAAARNYSANRPRHYSDIDICVSSTDFDAVKKLVEMSNTRLASIDLHNELRHMDAVPWQVLFDRSSLIETGSGSIRILSPEDHLRVMATHWLNDGGTNKEKLWDIYYAVANRPTEFDWSVCLESVNETRRSWVLCAIGLAHKYLDLPIDDLPFEESLLKIPAWVTKTLEKEWASGEQMQPLQTCLDDPKKLIRQLRKRFPPNPIQAAIDLERKIDDSRSYGIQVQHLIRRAGPSLERIFSVLRQKYSSS